MTVVRFACRFFFYKYLLFNLNFISFLIFINAAYSLEESFCVQNVFDQYHRM